jgi:hypothetical protein
LNPVLSVGDIGIALDAPEESVPPGLVPFLRDKGQVTARCNGRHGPVDADADARMLFDSGGIWRVDESAEGIQLVLRSGPAPGVPYHRLRLNPDLDRGQVVLDSRDLLDGPAPFLLRPPMHELWVSFLLMRGRGLLLHGCGLLVDRRAILFLGESGAGKSTLAGILEGAFPGGILTDDRLVLRPGGDGFRAYGTPWHGESRFASPASGELAGVYFLGKASHPSVSDLLASRAAGRLFSCCFLAGWPRSDLDFVLDLCTRVAESVPCRELFFRPDQSVLAVLSPDGAP